MGNISIQVGKSLIVLRLWRHQPSTMVTVSAVVESGSSINFLKCSPALYSTIYHRNPIKSSSCLVQKKSLFCLRVQSFPLFCMFITKTPPFANLPLFWLFVTPSGHIFPFYSVEIVPPIQVFQFSSVENFPPGQINTLEILGRTRRAQTQVPKVRVSTR